MAKKKKPKLTHHDAHVTPLAEIFSVKIHSDNNQQACEIYGGIRVVDELRGTFDIYERDKDQAESINLGQGGSLLLTAPLDPELAVIIASDHVSLDLLLFDRAYDDMPILEGEITLDRSGTISDWEDDYRVKLVEGNHGFCASVEYAIFPYAVVADVSVLFFHKNDHFDTLERNGDVVEDDQAHDWDYERPDVQDVVDYEEDECSIMANLFGAVTASTGRSNKYSSILFRQPVDGCVKVKSGGFIELSRSVVAVPAYAPLKIEATFFYGDTLLPIAGRTLEFKPQDCTTYKKDIVGDNGRIRVRVTWSHAYEQLHTLLEDSDDELSQLTLEKAPENGESSSITRPILNKIKGLPMFEVFSILVCSNDYQRFALLGEIIVQDDKRHCIFKKNASCPQECLTSEVLPIVTSSYRGFTWMGDFSMTLNLEDESGDTISFGHIIWRSDYISENIDRRMRTLVRGERGFAVVHYSMFGDGLSAALTVKLHGHSLPGKVKGKLYARYANYDYSNSYEEKYFQSILFYDEKDGVSLDSSGSTLPLAKSKVAVPTTTHLIIVADLSLSPFGTNNAVQDDVCLKGCVELKDDAVSSWRIGEDDLYIYVSVEYSRPW